jgi:hypothetical protein
MSPPITGIGTTNGVPIGLVMFKFTGIPFPEKSAHTKAFTTTAVAGIPLMLNVAGCGTPLTEGQQPITKRCPSLLLAVV